MGALSTDAYALVRRKYLHGFTILRHGTARHRDAGGLEQVGQLGVGERFARVSLSIRRRIIDWMAMLDASPPPSVLTPEAKNARSGKVPRGVRTYLRAMARETVDS